MKVLIAIDSSPASQRVLEEVAARPWPPNAAFCIVTAVEMGRFAELPALIEDAKRECQQMVKGCAALLQRAKLTATTQVLIGAPRRVISAYAQEWGAHRPSKKPGPQRCLEKSRKDSTLHRSAVCRKADQLGS